MDQNDPLIDIGVNLTNASFAHDIDALLKHAHQSGVANMVLIGSDLGDSREAIALAEQYDNMVTTAGIHPHHADTLQSDSMNQLRDLALNHADKVKALGEMGLDFNRNFTPQHDQLDAFEAQLKLAVEMGLPVYLHQRDAHDAFLELLTAYRPRLPRAVLHCFTGGISELQAYLAQDLHIGITGWICDERRGMDVQESVKQIPLDRLMLETDAPYLLPRTITPKPKSRRNEPAYLPYVLAQVAKCLAMDSQELAAITTQNAKRFFDL